MKTFLQKIFGQKGEINYLYFSCFLLFLTALSLSHFYTWHLPLKGIPLYFFLYAIGQALLEVSCFVFLAYVIKRWTPTWSYYLFVSLSFLLMLCHFTHFLMVRVMGGSIFYIYKFFFGSGIEHLIASFQALNLNPTMILIAFANMFIIPIIGIIFYLLTHKLSRKKPLYVSLSQIVITIGITGTVLFILDLLVFPGMKRELYAKYQKTLPLGTTFLPPNPEHFCLNAPLPSFRNEEKTHALLPDVKLQHLPNIYLFVIETFRKDFLNVAPNLTEFAQKHIGFSKSYANANCTHLSWFAIFHADFPFYWSQIRDSWTQGSIPLQMLKKMGYEISVFSSADLRFFGMDKIMFGAERQLADSVEDYSSDWSLQPCDRDALCFANLEKKLKPQGQVYLIFLDSTHSEYSFPKDFPIKYEPISKEIDYLTIGPNSPEIELIKNRYRNAIHYVDSNFGKFFTILKEKRLYDDAIIAITGDHGEEFFEEGALFHGIHMNEYTTAVPLCLKLPTNDWTPQTELATHIDLFPSILHYLTKQNDFSALFDGKSIFSLERAPFRIVVQQNGADIPYEFLLEKPDLKLKARFVEPALLEILELEGSLHPNLLQH